MTALISLDGVMRTEVGDPIHEGLKLYRVLATSYRTVIATDGTKEEAEYWLRSNLIKGYADILDNTRKFEGEDLRLRQLKIMRVEGVVELFIDSDVDRCAKAYSSGVTALLFSSPKFVRTKREVKPWDELKVEVEKQQELRAKLTLDDLSAHRWE
jgi:hypothetical protein